MDDNVYDILIALAVMIGLVGYEISDLYRPVSTELVTLVCGIGFLAVAAKDWLLGQMVKT